MHLLPAVLRDTLLANHLRSQIDESFDPPPPVKLFTPDAGATWLISEACPDGEDLTLFGLCDLGVGCPELGTVSLAEIESLRGALGLPVERDVSFEPYQSLSRNAAEARSAGRIMR